MRVGINGIGIGGPTLAYWLSEYGHEPVLFERSAELRSGGFVVDFWGLGYEVAERMGPIDEIRAKATENNRLGLVDSDGEEIAGELHRADGDVHLAYSRYQDKLAKFVAKEQKGAATYRMFFAPKTPLGVWARNTVTRVSSLPGLTSFIAGRTVPPFKFEDYSRDSNGGQGMGT